jgi:hypothetical protein
VAASVVTCYSFSHKNNNTDQLQAAASVQLPDTNYGPPFNKFSKVADFIGFIFDKVKP